MRCSDAAGDLSVGPRLSGRNRTESLPYLLLECRPGDIQAHIALTFSALEKRDDVRELLSQLTNSLSDRVRWEAHAEFVAELFCLVGEKDGAQAILAPREDHNAFAILANRILHRADERRAGGAKVETRY
jgi:hypothetical protein